MEVKISNDVSQNKVTTFDLFEIERKEHYCLEERRVEPLANKEIKWGANSRVRV